MMEAPVLDVAELIGVETDNACSSTTCGNRKIMLTFGQATMAVEDALEPNGKGEHILLLCQTQPAEALLLEV